MKPNASNFKVHDSKPGSNPDPQDDVKSPLVPELQTFAKDIWLVEGPNVRDMGVMFTTRMTIVKLANGSVWIESPVPVPFETLKRIAELGPVTILLQQLRDTSGALNDGTRYFLKRNYGYHELHHLH